MEKDKEVEAKLNGMCHTIIVFTYEFDIKSVSCPTLYYIGLDLNVGTSDTFDSIKYPFLNHLVATASSLDK
jgi:hypothetical protein